MPMENSFKISAGSDNLYLRIAKGHFATNHSHTNYFIDVTTQKNRFSEAKAVADNLVSHYRHNTIIDTVLCLDGTEVIGTCIANGLTREDFANMNAHQTVYVIRPENTSSSQIIFRDNILPMISGKRVLIVGASITTGFTAKSAIEAVNYYGGIVAGVASIFSMYEEIDGVEVKSVFSPKKDLPDFASYDSHECPWCKEGKKIDALVNSHGYSKL